MIRCPSCFATYASTLRACPHCAHAATQVDGVAAWAPEMAVSGEGFKAEYFATLASLEARNFWFRGRNALIVWAMKRYFPQTRSFLEVGCGTGYVLSGIASAFPDAALVGSELYSDALRFAAQRVPRAEFMQMDARRIPYEDEFDAIGAFDVIEHIEQDEQVLGAMVRALRPGGGLLLTVPQHPWLWSVSDDYACHVRRYTARELHAKVRAAGLRVLRSTSFVSFLLPAMLASRRRGSVGRSFDPVDELRIGAAANGALHAVLEAEVAMIRMGLSFPVGGSRLIVAAKPQD